MTTNSSLLNTLKGYWANYIRSQGKEMFSKITSSDQAGATGSSIVRAVKSVLDFKTLTDRIICESFAGKEDMKIA